MLVRFAITTEMPTELATLRTSVSIAVPSVRRCAGKRQERDGVERNEDEAQAEALHEADDRRSCGRDVSAVKPVIWYSVAAVRIRPVRIR